MASQKYVARRHALILQGFSFLWRYVELRGECQESMFNLGRALHQMGLAHLAIHYYQKALSLPAWKLDVGQLLRDRLQASSSPLIFFLFLSRALRTIRWI